MGSRIIRSRSDCRCDRVIRIRATGPVTALGHVEEGIPRPAVVMCPEGDAQVWCDGACAEDPGKGTPFDIKIDGMSRSVPGCSRCYAAIGWEPEAQFLELLTDT